MNKIEFQRALNVPADGIVGPKTVAAFVASVTNLNAPALTTADYIAAAALAKVDVPRIRMIREVETGPFGSFDPQGRPTILFERHKFRAFTGGQFDKRFPEVSNRIAGCYSKAGLTSWQWQWQKMDTALRLDPEAAIKSCSWGLFQVMGFHWEVLGYASALDFAQRMATGEAAHLDACVRYLVVNKLDDEVRACLPGKWTTCIPLARAYNGVSRVPIYAPKLAAALAKFA